MSKSLNIIVSLILILSGCVSYQKHPDFIERQKKIYTASVMPPDIEIYRLNFRGDKDPMYDLMVKATKFSKEEIEANFKKKNYLIRKLDLSDNVLQHEPALKTALFNVKKLFNERLKDIKKRKEKKFTYSLGSEVNQFADIANADVLIFIKETGYKKTGGEIAKDIAKSVLFSAALAAVGGIGYMYISPNEALIQVAVVDSNTGDILWYNYNRDNTGVDLGNEKSNRNLLRALFNPFPKRIAQERKIIDTRVKTSVREQAPNQLIPQEVINASLDSVEEKAEEVVVVEPIIKTEDAIEDKEAVEALPAPVENYRNVIIERIKTQLPPNFTPLSQPVWLHVLLLKSGAVKELGVLKDRSNSDKEIQRVALRSVDKALPMPEFPEDISDNELSLDIPIN